MKNNHTRLTRLAAISLVVVMCLSALPMLAPSASAAGGDVTPLGSSGGGRGKICITFDDGVKSVYDYAYPVMSAAGITATMFVVTDWIGGETSESKAPCMDLTELHVLQNSGWEIGSHSVSHSSFTDLTPEQVIYEFAESKSILTDLGFAVDTFAYPYGDYSAELVTVGAEYYARQRTISTLATSGNFLSDYPSTVLHTGAYMEVPTWEEVQALIDRAILTDTTLILLYHQLEEGGKFRYTEYDIQTLVDYIVEMRELYGLQTINYRDLPNSAPDADTYVWDGEGATDLASEAANWYRRTADGIITNDVLPTSNSNLVWNETSLKDCDYDLDIVAHSWHVSYLYTGFINQTTGHDISIGNGSLHLMNGRLVGSASDNVIIAGDIRARGGIYDNTNIVCIGDGVIETMDPRLLKSLTVYDTTYYLGTLVTMQLTVGSDGELHLMPSTSLAVRATGSGEYMHIDGKVCGPGTLKLDVRATGAIYDISYVESPVLLEQWSEIASPSVTTLYGNSAAELRIVNQHATHQMTVKASESLSVTGLTLSAGTILMGGDSVITTTTWDTSAGAWAPERSTVVLSDGGSAVLAPGQSFNELYIASDDGRTASWTMTATGAQTPIVTGLKSGSYLWYLDGVEQGEVEADRDGTIALSYQSTGLHELSVEPTSMTIAMDGVAAAVGIVAVLAVLGGLITMVGRIKI